MNCFARCLNFSSPQPIRLATRLTCRSLVLPTMAAKPSTLGPAPWRKLFLEHIQTMPAPEFALGTVRKTASPGGTVYSPRARTCIYRGLLADLPANPKNEAERNPDVYETDFPTFTTDCRMDKMAELFGVEVEASGDLRDQDARSRLKGSGGGAQVEAVFWVRDTATQWRIRGRAYVLAPDIEDLPEGKQVIATLVSRMRRKDPSSAGASAGAEGREWSFSREITACFGNLSPVMRGSFRNPPPGTPVELPVDDDRLGLGQKVTDLHDEVARANFRVVVIVPEAVDRVDLSDMEHSRRWQYTFLGGDGSKPTAPGGIVENGWETVEVWP